ncbi:RNA polymerase, sigma subunit, ECF family [Granulicella rosea]|uniref:RNA polymerase, sigma subunit, ECF family n=1 Tax=Granulicella rosea TaxID=474952 RepID=A0A239LYX8_9BACT|nr:sigma-70 family RNA polymerase sigma factor [Granulicella rosea]SNT35003.1 RNA polymerase, sigma subunit, ECF family [Granulicella rosea]
MTYLPGDVTQLLHDLNKGDRVAQDRLIPVVYKELRQIAGRYLRKESPDHSLQPTALVNEVYLRLVKVRDVDWHSRSHFFAVSATLMRRILVDHARANYAAKRGAGISAMLLDDNLAPMPVRPPEIVALDAALTAFEKLDPEKARIVEMRFFGGFTELEIAEHLNISERTVKRHWRIAKAWLYDELNAHA